ncbi:ABC transporter permease [Eubacteriaceae bacterium ES3]|nr:ABC transporter permease [Eubacteriaceae bacterium ES3]
MFLYFLSASVRAGTCLLFATLGEIISEKVGHTNLGVEGMMQMGAVIGFIAGFVSGNPYVAILCAALAGMAGALIYALLTVTFKANQIVTGLTLSIFGTGFATFFGKNYIGKKVPEAITNFFAPVPFPGLSKIPVLGEVFFNQSIYVYFSYLLVVLVFIYLYKTKWGLHTRMVGENPAAADASGISVDRYKYFNIALSGALSGLGGAFLSLVYISILPVNVVGGRGWIAVALVIFATWNPIRAMVGAYFFGALDIAGYWLQQYNLPVSIYLFDALPYLATVFVLLFTSMKKSGNSKEPAWLGRNYFKEDR